MIKKYQNGNVTVTIDLRDGTKVRETPDDEFRPDFAESCDVHISDRCDNGCEFCYAGCSQNGKFGKLLNWKFIDSLHPYTEMAINLQAPIHPDLVMFLIEMKKRNVVVNATVNQNHFMNDAFRSFLNKLIEEKLIYGVGISLTNPTDDFIRLVRQTPNVVIHVINGIISTEELRKLAYHGFSILILGYKKIGRGAGYYSQNVKIRQEFLYWNLGFIMKSGWFDRICFDNLAIEQLNPRRLISDAQWDLAYQGEDGTSTFFINLVDGTFGKNSLTTREERMEIGNKTIDEMFKIVKEGLI